MSSAVKQDYQDFEIIVIDDGSVDKTLEWINKFKDKRVRLIKNKINKGPGFIRNIGIKKAEGDIVLFLDSDTIVPGDWIRGHVKEQEYADIVGGGIIGVHKTVFGEADALCAWFTSIPNSKRMYLKKFHLPTNNLSIKKNVFNRIGYFKDLRISEDAEFCNRALKNGIKILFSPDILARHYDRDNLKDYLRHQYSGGLSLAEIRKQSNLEYAWLMPPNFFISLFYIVPIAFLYTAWLVGKWFRYKPKVIFYIPLLFIGKLAQTIAISKSFLR